MVKAAVKTKTGSLSDTKKKVSTKPSPKISTSSEPKPTSVKKSGQKGKGSVPVKTARSSQVTTMKNTQKSSDASSEQLFVGTVKSKRPGGGPKNTRQTNQKGALAHQSLEVPIDLSTLTKNTIYSAWSAAKLFLIGFVFILLLGGAIYWIGTHARAGL